MRIILLPLIVTIASANAGFLNGGHHFVPATNIVASRTIVGGAVGGGPTAGAVSAAQYSQTVAAPASVHTVITSHPGTNVGYPGPGSSGVSSGNSAGGGGGQNSGAATFGNYVYHGGPGGSGSSSQGSSGGSGGYGGQSGSSRGGLNSGFNQHPSSYYNHHSYY